MPDYIELLVKVKGHYDFDVTDPADVKMVYVNRPTIIKAVLSEQGIKDTMKERGIPRSRAIEDLFIESARQNVKPEDIVAISSQDEKALDRITGVYDVPKAKLTEADMHNPKHVTPLKEAE